MDRAYKRENNQDININKVVNKIGLEERIKFDSIDVFVDANNQDNLWAVANYNIYRRKQRIPKEQVIRFNNYNEMILFLQNNFDAYELNHHVDYLRSSIHIHKVDYIGMDYYLHEGKPNLNYIEINYKEYVNDGFHVRKRILPKEYEKMLLNIIKINKKTNSLEKLDSEFYREINVNEKKAPFIDEDYDERRISRRERRIEKEKNQMPMPEPKKSHRIRNIVICASVVALLSAGAVTLVRNSEYKKEVITQENSDISILDFHLANNKNRILALVNDLIKNDYHNISDDDLDFFFDYVSKVSLSNYDNNKSGTYFNYQEYFDSIIWENSSESAKIVSECSNVLDKIENKYHNCFKMVDNKLTLDERNAKSYLDYVTSLTFMYDTLVDRRNSGLVDVENNLSISKYAPKEEIEAYNRFPRVLKYVILEQLQGVLTHSNYSVSERPSNYYGGLERIDLINEVKSLKQDIEYMMKTDAHLAGKKNM